MSGRTAMYVGYWHGRMTHVPFSALEGQKRQINPLGDVLAEVEEGKISVLQFGDVGIPMRGVHPDLAP